MKLIDFAFTDKNECEEWGFCDQKCKNSVGSYQCSCLSGYERTSLPNGKGEYCKAKADRHKMQLYFISSNKIVVSDPTGTEVSEILNTSAASGLDFYTRNRTLFYTDTEARKIFRIDMDNPNKTPYDYNMPGAWSPVAVAVDWISSNIYVVDALGQRVDVFDQFNIYHAIVLSKNLTAPSDIALDPTAGLMFIADNNRIIRANMDGSNVIALVSDTVYKAAGVSVDLITQRVYWSDVLLDYIESVDYEGNNRQSIVRGNTVVPAPTRITLFERRVFWTDSNKNGVYSVDKFNSSDVKTIYHMPTNGKGLKAIKAVHDLLQPSVENPCKKAHCQHMCLVTATSAGLGYKCACKLGYKLSPNRQDCLRIYEFLMYSQQKFIKGKVLNEVGTATVDAVQPVVSRSARFVGLDFDSHADYIYYSDVILDVIYRIKKDGTVRENVLASQNEGVEGLAIDWASHNLYYIDSRKGTLNVLSTNKPSNRKVLLKDLKRPPRDCRTSQQRIHFLLRMGQTGQHQQSQRGRHRS